MDTKPFLEFNILEISDAQVEELKRFTKSSFQLEDILDAARELKYTKEIKRILAEQLSDPSDDFVKFFATPVYSGKMTQRVRQQFSQLTKRALNQFINDRINDRLELAKATEGETLSQQRRQQSDDWASDDTETAEEGTGIVTTEEELEGYYIVKAILHGVVDVKRITMRDMKSFCGVLLDNNNRKPICRLWFNASQKYVGLIDTEKQEERIPIKDVDDIYNYADRLKATVGFYN